MIKYPSIEHYRNIIRTVKSNNDYKGKDENGVAIYNHTEPYPTLNFKGTVKLHGTNAGIVKRKTGITFQSRERELSLTSDNAGFMLAMSNKDLDFLFEGVDFIDYIAVFGEWCGKGIQKGVGICSLPKMFVIFGYKVDGAWVNLSRYDNAQGIYHINQFPTYNISIDFNNPEAMQNKLIELTLAVEEECPVAKHFGVSGLGEGIVFECVEDPTLRFKSKGEKHSSSKVKVLNSVDTEELESIKEFVEYAVTDNRLAQGMQYLKDNVTANPDQKNMGDFIRWVVNDIVKEEPDTIEKNQINMKKANKAVSSKCREYFFNNI